MKQERKESLLCAFPPVPSTLMEQMNKRAKKSVGNFAVMLTNGNELFVRCYHHYYDGRLVERQRYVFAKDGCCRYGSDDGVFWIIRKEFREPVFCASSYGYNFDNSYIVLNKGAIKKSCMKYSCAELYIGAMLMEYLKLYIKHPNVEYLMKSGYQHLISETETGYWGGHMVLNTSFRINWKSNNLLKMLGLTRAEFKLLKGYEDHYEVYCRWRENFPEYKPEELFLLARVFEWNADSACNFSNLTGVRLPRLARYLESQRISRYDYRDYVEQCQKLNYNLHDTAICMPRDFRARHIRFSEIIGQMKIEENRRLYEEQCRLFNENYQLRSKLQFSFGKYLIRQPESMDEITAEGMKLHHCVGGYAKRHAEGKLHILFIRRIDAPEDPLYTMELSVDGEVKQVRGLRNCDPTKDAKAFVEEYKQYIAPLFDKRQKARITA